jgi:hypothetical protein
MTLSQPTVSTISKGRMKKYGKHVEAAVAYFKPASLTLSSRD